MLSAKILAVLENQKDPKPREKAPKGTNRPKGCNPRGNRGKLSLCAKDEGFLIRVAHSKGQTVQD